MNNNRQQNIPQAKGRIRMNNPSRKTRQAARVAIVFDWQNTLLTARGLLPPGVSPRQIGLHPLRLARAINSERIWPSELVEVWVVTGIPSKLRDAAAHAKQIADFRHWATSQRVRILWRPLAYDRRGIPREKGIDVLIAQQLADLDASDSVDTIVLFSNDRDLDPAVERILDNKRTRFEGARWEGSPGRLLPGRKFHVHYLGYEALHRSSRVALYDGAA